jgi:uroporphyrinogen decarboxylase
MDHRERVMTAINHEEPDRVPTAIWGSTYGITDPLYYKLVKRFNLSEPVDPFRKRRGHSVNYYDDRILDALDIDVRHVWLGFSDLAGPTKDGGVDAWGIGWEQFGIYFAPTQHPLAEANLEDILRYSYPDVEKFIRLDELRRRTMFLKGNTDYAVVGRSVDSYGPFERACSLMGTEKLMLNIVLDEDLVIALVEKITDVLCRLTEIYMEVVGQWLDIIELPGDDYAAENPLISPKHFDRIFSNSWRRIIDIIRDASPNCKITFHSDGRMTPFLSRLIDLGVDVFHCLEPLPNIDMVQVKNEYGSHLCFLGAIDIKEAMRRDVYRVEEEVKRRILELGPGGGYILAPANHLQPDVPPENVEALFRAAKKFGIYPIS